MTNIKTHYTSVSAFYNIINSQQMRLTKSQFLNDPQEISVTWDYIQTFLSDYYQENKEEIIDDIVNKTFVPKDKENLEMLFSRYNILAFLKYVYVNIVDYYILSLSENEDSLPMWNYYSNSGIGLAIDIDELFIDENIRSYKNKITYVNTKFHQYFDLNLQELFMSYGYSINYLNQRELIGEKYDIEKNFQIIYENIFEGKYNRTQFSETVSTSRTQIFESIFSLLAFQKIDTYAYEEEYRVAIISYNTEKESSQLTKGFDTYECNGKQFIRPYIEMEINLKAIKSLILAPDFRHLPIDLETYIKMLREFTGNEDLPIKESEHFIRW